MGNTGFGVTAANGTGGEGDPNVCAQVEVGTQLEVTPGNLMVIFDRSLSMAENFDTANGPAAKWQAAGDALMRALEPFACAPGAAATGCVDQLTVGAVLFPTRGDPTGGIGLELDIIAAVVIGGGSLSGGEGRVTGSVVGALIIAILRSGCQAVGVENYVQNIVIGSIIIIAVGIDQLRRSRG